MSVSDLSKDMASASRPVAGVRLETSLPIDRVGGKELVVVGPAFRNVIAQARQVADLDVGVLLLGERGTGKSVIAEVIHNLSRRASVPFQEFNCAAMPEELAERILFGSVKGAFTGAQDDKGLFEAADGGTLFLDEIGDSSAALQAKLLRVLETKTVTRLGSHKPVACDVRLIFATNKKLETLRPDFVDRIDEAQISIPPLRERREDLPALIEFCFTRMKLKFPSRVKPYALDTRALKVLCEYDWPGNIRQLGSVVLKIALTCIDSETILPSDVGSVLRRRQGDNPPSEDALRVEDALVNNVDIVLSAPAYRPGEPLDFYFARVLVTMYEGLASGARVGHAEIARRLGIERTTLYRRLKAARTVVQQGVEHAVR